LNSKDKEIYFNIGEIITCTTSEGPFKRMAIFFQGCDIRCEGCYNKQYWSLDISNRVTLNELLNIIIKSKNINFIEGVTFLGGEPTLQCNLKLLAKQIKQIGLGIIMFTGRKFGKLDSNLLQYLDIVVDGEFEENNLDDSRNLIGSKNQRIYVISNRYKDSLGYYESSKSVYDINILDQCIVINGSKL